MAEDKDKTKAAMMAQSPQDLSIRTSLVRRDLQEISEHVRFEGIQSPRKQEEILEWSVIGAMMDQGNLRPFETEELRIRPHSSIDRQDCDGSQIGAGGGQILMFFFERDRSIPCSLTRKRREQR